jgi:hypothetical protein
MVVCEMSSEPEEPYLGYYPDAELVVALVCPLGTAYQRVVETLENCLGQFKYRANVIRLSELFEDLLSHLGSEVADPGPDRAAQSRYKIQAGNTIRRLTGRNHILALVAAGLIADRRLEQGVWMSEDVRSGRRGQRPTNALVRPIAANLDPPVFRQTSPAR